MTEALARKETPKKPHTSEKTMLAERPRNPQELAITLSKLSDLNGLKIRVSENSMSATQLSKLQFQIVDERTGEVLPFVLQSLERALQMQKLLADATVRQETCLEKKSLLDTCKMYSEKSSIWYATDLRMDEKNWFLRDSDVVLSERIEDTLRWSDKKHSTKDGMYSFATGMASFLNTVSSEREKLTVAKKSIPQQLAQK